jgi:magnesium-transporting ATPase (P-type)
MVTGVFALFLHQLSLHVPEATAQTMAVNTVVLYQVFYLFNVRRNGFASFGDHFERGAQRAWLAVATILALQAAFIHVPLMNQLFHSTAITPQDWLLCAAVASSVFFLVELEKLAIRRWRGAAER